MDRKMFIKTCGFACLGGSVLTVLEGCVSPEYVAQTILQDRKIVLKKTEFSYIQKDKHIERKYVLVRNDKFRFPIYVRKQTEQTYSALLMECTHRSCELNPQGDFLVCPCHGSEFSNEGVVQNPPANRNLSYFKTSTDDENIYIHL
jgi:cytochrome b6-f complex iron-sulfur subunit